MEQYISKSALVAKIERRIKNLYPKGGQGMVLTKVLRDHYEDLLSCINTLEVKELGVDFGDPKGDKSAKCIIDTNTLEVKEVDLGKEIEKCLKQHNMLAVGRKDFTDIAKRFFELGMSVNNKVKKGD